jgi:hypothetical protein
VVTALLEQQQQQHLPSSWWDQDEDGDTTTRTDDDDHHAAVNASVCPECYSIRVRVRADNNNTRADSFAPFTCGDRIVRYHKSGNYPSLFEARRAVARDLPNDCGPCDPSSCRPHQTIFRRPDRMAPPIANATTH